MQKDKGQKQNTDDPPVFIGTSPAMQKVYERIKRLAPHDIPVFITGKTGTGKEICAESLHFYSKRNHHPFVALNCAALPPAMIDSALFGHVRGAYTNAERARSGAIEQAEGGTLFLDEVCEMPLESQAKLLRFTQKYEYQKLGSDTTLKANIRIICATNVDPYEHVKKNKFREDLYYRLFVAPIHMPSLRKRDEDVIDIAMFYLHHYSKKYAKAFEGFSEGTISLLLSHDWPGNVRELENLIHETLSSYDGSIVTTTMLPDHIGSIITKKEKLSRLENQSNYTMPLWRIEKRAIEAALYQNQNNVQKAAEILDVAPSTIYRKMKEWKKGQN